MDVGRWRGTVPEVTVAELLTTAAGAAGAVAAIRLGVRDVGRLPVAADPGAEQVIAAALDDPETAGAVRAVLHPRAPLDPGLRARLAGDDGSDGDGSDRSGPRRVTVGVETVVGTTGGGGIVRLVVVGAAGVAATVTLSAIAPATGPLAAVAVVVLMVRELRAMHRDDHRDADDHRDLLAALEVRAPEVARAVTTVNEHHLSRTVFRGPAGPDDQGRWHPRRPPPVIIGLTAGAAALSAAATCRLVGPAAAVAVIAAHHMLVRAAVCDHQSTFTLSPSPPVAATMMVAAWAGGVGVPVTVAAAAAAGALAVFGAAWRLLVGVSGVGSGDLIPAAVSAGVAGMFLPHPLVAPVVIPAAGVVAAAGGWVAGRRGQHHPMVPGFAAVTLVIPVAAWLTT